MKKRFLLRSVLPAGALALALALANASASYAAASEKDMQIIAKALGFIEGGPSGEVKVDVIFDPANAESVADADAVAGLLASGLVSGKITLKGAKTESSSGAKVAYIAKGAEGKASSLAGVITVSANPDCAISGKCVLGVSTTPKVEIHVSSSAASAVGASFGSAFRMMITEH